MPGFRLNDTEKHLRDWWNSSNSFVSPVLKGISIRGSPGLRGICEMDITFDYPLTVICGQNGSGKTTLLSLSALAFHAPDRHYSFQARNYNKRKIKSYYTFVDFFFKGIKDPDITGVEITWNYDGNGLSERGKTKTIKKQTNKWMKYDTRPKRPVHYFGASRVLPAIERNVLRGHFKINRSQHRTIQLNDEFIDIFCGILGRNYSNATVTQSDKYSLGSCEYGSSYTSFNMGAGEDILLELLYYLQESPTGSLIIIEEIELGLHPEAQRKFAQNLLEIIWKKKFQVVVSSHSSTFIDSVPRIARILIQRTGFDSHNVVKTPTTRYAMGFLHGDTRSELKVYCEDSFAERIITTSLRAELRKRVDVVGVGDNNQVATQCAAHVKGNWPGKYLGVFDGDIEVSDMIRKMRNELPPSIEDDEMNYIFLPENPLPPEKWVVQEILADENRLNNLKYDFVEEDSSVVKSYLDRVSVLPNHHNIGYELSKFSGFNQTEVEGKIIRAACQNNEKLQPLTDKIKLLLDGIVFIPT